MRYTPLIALTLSLVVLAACDNNSSNSASPTPHTSPQGLDTGGGTFLSVDGSLQIKCPNGWALNDLHDEADLEVANIDEDTYLIILSELRADYAFDMTQHSADTRDMLITTLSNAKQVGPNELEINGNPAIQYKIYGAFERTNVVYLHTTIQTNEKLHQVVAWTVASKFPKFESIFQEMIGTILEVQTDQ